MTTEEIKQNVKMEAVLNGYGIKVRRNMCSCPFHGRDRHPSMKVYKDGVHCFTCGANFDQIGFVMAYEGVDFKTAFYALGGAYKTGVDDSKRKAIQKVRDSKRRERDNKEQADHELFLMLKDALELCDLKNGLDSDSDEFKILADVEPFLDWAYKEKFIEGKEINEIDVYRKCREVRQKIFAISGTD